MTFVSAITSEVIIFGSKQIRYGTYEVTGATTTGDVDTGLKSCESFSLQAVSNGVQANAPTYEETLPAAGNAITIHSDTVANGTWMAIGKIE